MFSNNIFVLDLMNNFVKFSNSLTNRNDSIIDLSDEFKLALDDYINNSNNGGCIIYLSESDAIRFCSPYYKLSVNHKDIAFSDDLLSLIYFISLNHISDNWSISFIDN